jgi:hypothetical protein
VSTYMPVIGIAIGIIILLGLLFVVARIIRSCLPKIVIGLIILGILAYLVYTYVLK